MTKPLPLDRGMRVKRTGSYEIYGKTGEVATVEDVDGGSVTVRRSNGYDAVWLRIYCRKLPDRKEG